MRRAASRPPGRHSRTQDELLERHGSPDGAQRGSQSLSRILEQGLDGLDAERDVPRRNVLVGRVDVRVRQREARDDRRDSLVGQCRDDRQRATGADQRRARAEHALEGVLAELDRAGIGRHDSRPSRRQALHVEIGALRGGGADQLFEGRRDRVLDPGLGARRTDTLATARTGSTVFSRRGEPLSNPLTSSAGSAVVRM